MVGGMEGQADRRRGCESCGVEQTRKGQLLKTYWSGLLRGTIVNRKEGAFSVDLGHAVVVVELGRKFEVGRCLGR